MDIEVKGHSGCQIEIVQSESNQLVVKKSTIDPGYFNRLCLQAEKQSMFNNFDIKHIKVPKVFSMSKSSHEVSFRMEYVYSSNFVDYFEKIYVHKIDEFVDTITNFIDNSITNSPVTKINGSIISAKYSSVKKNIKENINITKDLESILQESDGILHNISDIHIPIGISHGDLTLSNMLFNGDDISLIDFLDSFIESPIVDIVKIRQDTYYKWSLQMYTGEFDKLRMDFLLNYIDQKIDTHFKKHIWYNTYYHIFELINLLRVLQYSNNEDITIFLIKALNKCLNKVQ